MHACPTPSLSGVRYQRLRLGRWVSAEGIVYDEYDANVHLLDALTAFHGAKMPPANWPRSWSIDFGYTHPFVWQAWAKDPETDALYRFAELYHTGLIVEKVAATITAWMNRSGEEFPEAIICDHDAEGRATLRDKLGVPTIAAKKSVATGIQTVKQRLAGGEDGLPGLYLVCDAGIMRDTSLFEAKQPTSTEEEIELYIWEDGIRDSTPVEAHDHGMDAMRNVTMHVDKGGWSLAEIAAFGRGESGRRRPGSASAPAKPESKPKPTEPEKPAETPEEKQRRWEEEVAEMNRRALIRARGGKE